MVYTASKMQQRTNSNLYLSKAMSNSLIWSHDMLAYLKLGQQCWIQDLKKEVFYFKTSVPSIGINIKCKDIFSPKGPGTPLDSPLDMVDKGWTIKKVMGGFSACTNIFFRPLLVPKCFLQLKPFARKFFKTNIALFVIYELKRTISQKFDVLRRFNT